MKKVAIYLRVSTNAQDYERQRHEIEAYCKSNQYDIVNVFEEKISGAKDDRPQFNALCDLTSDDINAVIVWEISRLGRKLTTVIKAVEDFKDKGINVISLKEHFELFEKDGRVSPSSMIMMSLFSTMAVIERENIMERSRSGKLDKLNNGQLEYTDKAPYGYRLVNGKLEVFEDEAEVVRNIYTNYINGFSQTQIAKVNGVHQSKVARILSNGVYCGQPYSNLLNKTLTAPQIVSVDTYTTARDICEQRTIKRAKTSHLKYKLKCKMYCDYCGHVLSRMGEESWGCHCRKTSIQSKFVDKATEMVVKAFNETRQDTETFAEYQEKMANLNNSIDTLMELVNSTQMQLIDATAKLELLKDIFTADKLKKEVSEVKRLEKDLESRQKELRVVKTKRVKTIAAYMIDSDYKDIDDITEKVLVHVVDRATKAMEFIMIDGTRYIVTIRTRKNEYTIKKEGD